MSVAGKRGGRYLSAERIQVSRRPLKIPGWMKIERTEIVASGVIGAILGGALVAVFTPTLTLVGGRIASFFYPPSAAVTIQACAPLKSAREIVSFHSPTKGLQVLEDFNRHVRNETSYMSRTSLVRT